MNLLDKIGYTQFLYCHNIRFLVATVRYLSVVAICNMSVVYNSGYCAYFFKVVSQIS